MTPLPKRKLSRARQGKRRAAIKLSLTKLVVCKNCGIKVKPHTMCDNCGFYNGNAHKTIKVKHAAK